MAKLNLHDVEVWKAYVPACQYSARMLADRAGVSRSHLRRCSEQLFHTSPQKVCDTIRLLTAPDVLEDELSVKLVAERIAFKQQSQLSRDFKAFYGICPKDYLALSKSERLALKLRVQSRVELMTVLATKGEPGEKAKMNTTDTKWSPQIRLSSWFAEAPGS